LLGCPLWIYLYPSTLRLRGTCAPLAYAFGPARACSGVLIHRPRSLLRRCSSAFGPARAYSGVLIHRLRSLLRRCSSAFGPARACSGVLIHRPRSLLRRYSSAFGPAGALFGGFAFGDTTLVVPGGSGAATQQYRNRSTIGELSFTCLQPLGLGDEPLEGEVIMK